MVRPMLHVRKRQRDDMCEMYILQMNPHTFSDKNSQMQHNMTFFSTLFFKCFVDDIFKLCKLLTQGLVTCIDLEISMIVLTLTRKTYKWPG